MNILVFIAMPFYSPLGFLRLYQNKPYFYFFLSCFPILAYFYTISTLFNLFEIRFNILVILIFSSIFYLFSIVKTSLVFSLLSRKTNTINFKTLFSINTVSLYPFFLFLPISNILKSIWGLDFLFFLIPFFVSIILKKEYIKKIYKIDSRIYILIPLINFMIITVFITVVSMTGWAFFIILLQTLKELIF